MVALSCGFDLVYIFPTHIFLKKVCLYVIVKSDHFGGCENLVIVALLFHSFS